MRILYDSKLTQFKSPFGVLTPGQTCTLHMMLPVTHLHRFGADAAA